MQLNDSVLGLIKQLRKDAVTTGIASGTGLNFYYLEPQAKNIYPVFYPLLASTPRRNPMFNGMKVGGEGINWKAILAIDTGGYPAISEGNRNAFMNYTEKDFYAPYKFLGKDTEVTFQAQQMGMGFDDNIATAQLGQLNALLNGEERMVLFGNSGPANAGGAYGFALGTTPTPVTSAVATQTGSNGVSTGILSGTSVTVYCVAITAWGTYLASTTSLALPAYRQNADGSQDLINGGTGIISAVSNSTSTSSGNLTIKATLPNAVLGAVAYAWYVSSAASPTTANAYFWGTTPYPTVFLSNLPSTGNQAANATNSGTNKGLTTDNSYNTLDFDGMMTWGFNWTTQSYPSYWVDYNGAGFTSGGDGTIVEFENVFNWAWLNYKLTFDKIYVGGALISAISKAIMTSSTGPGAQRILFDRGDDGSIVGGTKLIEYRSKFSNSGAPKSIPVLTHPWMPDGCVFFHLIQNPYPAAGASIDSVWSVMSLEDHFSIKWPYRRLQHEVGTYCFETLTSKIPFGTAILTGLKNVVN